MKKIPLKNIKLKKVLKWTIILVMISLVVHSCYKNLQPKQKEQQIVTSKAVIGRVEAAITGKGTLSPADQYEVKSLVKGEILKAPFEEGDTVKKGQLLYQISTSEIENNIKSAELSVDRAKLSYDNYMDQKDNLLISSTESGYIKKLYIKEGDTLQAGRTIADIYNDDIMYIDLLFPSYEVKSSWIGKTASVSMEATGEAMEGKVSEVSNMEETLEGGILAKKVTIRIKNKGGIMSGDTAEASVDGIFCSNSGNFRAETETTLVAEIGGKIESLNVKEGQYIQKGDMVLSLTSTDLDNQIENSELTISEAELALETTKEQMNQYTIEAPISGKVITKGKKKGDTIDPAYDSQAGPMAIIYDLSHLTFELNIDELQVRSIRSGQKVTIKTEAFPEDTFEGVIEKISLKGITNNGVTTYPVTVKVDNYGDLLPSMNVTGKIMIEEANNVLVIPSAALQRGNIVYVKSVDAEQEDGSEVPEGFEAVPVEIGINDGTNVEIKNGLVEGDEVYVPFDSSKETSDGEISQDETVE